MPDFWMAWNGFPQTSGSPRQDPGDRRRRDGAGPIHQAIEWYGVDKKEAMFVSSTAAGLFAANVAGVTSIQYPSPSGITDTQRLRAEIQRILGLGRRRSA